MTVSYNTTVKGTRMQAVLDAVDAGAGPGTMEIASAAFAAILATITLADPSFTRAADVLTLAGTPRSDTSADATGTAAVARIKDSNGTIVITGLTVGTSGADINLNSVSLTAGQAVTITSGTITHAA